MKSASGAGAVYLLGTGLAALVCLTALPQCRAQTATAALTTGAHPSAVAVNPVTNRIYVANFQSGTVTVIDGATNHTIATLPVGAGASWVAVNPVTNQIYVSADYGGNVTVIDGSTSTVTATIATGSEAIEVGLNPVTNKIYVANEYAGTMTVIDGYTNAATTITTGLNPQAAAVNTLTNKIYVPAEYSSTITVVDGATNTTTTLPAPAGSAPQSAAVNEATNKIYIANQYSNNVTVIDGATNATTTVPTGSNAYFVAVNPLTNKIYVANRWSSNVTVIDGATNNTTTVPAGPNPYWLAVNPVTNKIYVAAEYSGYVTVIDGATNTTVNVPAGQSGDSVAVNPVTNKIYVANSGDGTLTVIDGATNNTTTITAGSGPSSTAVNPVSNKTYVANRFSNNVTVIDGATNNTAAVAAGSGPIAVAVNPFTNQIYVANNGGGNVTVIDGNTNNTTTVAAGLNPVSVAVNPVTNQIYVANSGGNVTVIDGTTDNTTVVPAGSGPWSVAVNPVTNKAYVANQYSGNVTVIDGATNNTTTVAAGSSPIAVAVNPVTNKIYVANNGGGLTVISGDTSGTTTLPTGSGPNAVAVNPITNKIYVVNTTSSTVTVVDGATNATTNLAVGANPIFIAVNQASNKIYVANGASANVTVIDGLTNTTTTVAAGSSPISIAVNSMTNQIYVANNQGNSVTKITEQQVQPIPLTTTITPLPGNLASTSTPSFTFSASSSFSPIPSIPDTVYYQVDTWQGPWLAATGSNPSYSGTLAPLPPGFHILYAYAGDSEEATSNQPSPLIGVIQAYGFLSGSSVVLGPPLPPPTVTFTGAPVNAAYNSTFTVSATTNASTTASITASGACSIAGATVIMTAGTGTCSLKASWTADANYGFATANQFTTATSIAPTVSFTGAPVSAAYHSTFTVTATTNASVAASITALGDCSNSGNTVTMTSGTGACSLTATWAADSNYIAAAANQSTAAVKAAPAVTFTGAPATAAYNSSFTVATTTNASTPAAITSSGDCSNAANIITMGGSPGICSLTATWAADSNFNSATASQSTTASDIPPPLPLISNVAATGITTTSAIVGWTTDQASSSQVEFGNTIGYGSVSPPDSTLVISHSVTLTGLTPGLTYDYAVISAAAGGPATSGNFIFSTPATPPVTAITSVGGASSNTGSTNFPTSLSIPYTSSSGNTIVAVCALGSASSSISSIADSGSAWSSRAFVNNGTAFRSEIWSTSPGVSIASTLFTININGATPASCSLEEYAGVLSIGVTATSQAISGTASVSLTTHDPNDFIVAGLGANSYYAYLMTNGTMRQKGGQTSNSGNNYVEMVLCDNTAATATSVTCSAVFGPTPWAAPALELRAGSGGGGPAPLISSVASTNVTSTSATITWTTDQASNSQVKYGATIGYGSFSSLKSTPVTSHSVNLTGLTPGTTYNYAVISGDAGGTATSSNSIFSTPVSIPAISAVTSSGVTTTSATITWTTDQPSSSQVEYGITTGYESLSTLNSTPVTSHSVTLIGLTPGVTYDYAVMSANSAGPATSANFTFLTPLTSVFTVISPVGGAHNNTGSNSAPTSLSINYVSHSGNTIVAVCALGNTTSSISSITDNGSVWTFQAGVNNGAAVRSEIWSTTAGGSAASTSFTINLSSGSPASCALEEYTGVLSLGATAINQASSGTTSVTITIPEANDYVVAGLGMNSYYGYTITNGALRQAGGLTQNSGTNYVEMDLCDNTAAIATSLTCSSVSGPAIGAAPALVLR